MKRSSLAVVDRRADRRGVAERAARARRSRRSAPAARRARRRRAVGARARGRWPGCRDARSRLAAARARSRARSAATRAHAPRRRARRALRSASSAPAWASSLRPSSGSSSLEQRLGAGAADRVAAAQPGQAPGLREACGRRAAAGGRRAAPARRRAARRRRSRRSASSSSTTTRSGSASSSARSSPIGEQLARRVVGVAERDDARAVVDRARGRRRRRSRATGTAVRARAARHQRIERIGRPRRDQLVAGLDQRLRGRARAAARRRRRRRAAPRATPWRCGELGAQLGGVPVEVAVQAAARGVGDRVDDVGRRVLGPGRLREVERLDARERLARGARRPPRAARRVTSSSRHALELAVVVEEAHRCGYWRRRAASRPRPPPKISNQTVNSDAPITRREGEDAADDALALVVAGGAARRGSTRGRAA